LKRIDTINLPYVALSPTNVFTLECRSNNEKFKIANTDVNAKTIAITNSIDAEIVVRLDYRIAATFTYPTNLSWKDAVTPSFTAGKIYFLYISTDDEGSTYQGTWTGSW
jgi:hypothetical protein